MRFAKKSFIFLAASWIAAIAASTVQAGDPPATPGPGTHTAIKGPLPEDNQAPIHKEQLPTYSVDKSSKTPVVTPALPKKPS